MGSHDPGGAQIRVSPRAHSNRFEGIWGRLCESTIRWANIAHTVGDS